ncbi:unnamed protein product, partial [Ectocarpus sp. 12 AP-2014]
TAVVQRWFAHLSFRVKRRHEQRKVLCKYLHQALLSGVRLDCQCVLWVFGRAKTLRHCDPAAVCSAGTPKRRNRRLRRSCKGSPMSVGVVKDKTKAY